MADPIATGRWLEALVDAAGEVAVSFLGLDSDEEGRELGVCSPDSGAYISIVGEQSARHVGLVVDAAGCRKLANTMLCVKDDDELSNDDVADAVGEVMNIIAGGVKSRLVELDPSLEIGLPIIVEGRAHSPIRCQSGQASLTFGDVSARLVILGLNG